MLKKPTKCSIVIPVYNGEKFIKQTIQSCLEQTLPVEIIIINDASKDKSEELIQEFNEDNIIYIKNTVNLGLMKSLNKAIKHVSSEYFVPLGHDDLLAANHVELMLKEFKSDVSFVHCNADLINESNTVFGKGTNDIKQIIKTFFIKKYLSKSNFIHSTGTIVNKNLFNKVGGYDENFKNYGEWLLWIKLANVGKVKYCPKIRALYRRHETNITNSFGEDGVKKELKVFFNFCQHTSSKLFYGKSN